MIRGEVWDVADTTGQLRRVAIVSGELWNETARPQAVAIVRRHDAPEILPFLVALAETDPVTGILMMDTLGRIDPRDLVERVGTLTGATLAKVSAALRQVYEV